MNYPPATTTATWQQIVRALDVPRYDAARAQVIETLGQGDVCLPDLGEYCEQKVLARLFDPWPLEHGAMVRTWSLALVAGEAGTPRRRLIGHQPIARADADRILAGFGYSREVTWSDVPTPITVYAIALVDPAGHEVTRAELSAGQQVRPGWEFRHKMRSDHPLGGPLPWAPHLALEPAGAGRQHVAPLEADPRPWLLPVLLVTVALVLVALFTLAGGNPVQ